MARKPGFFDAPFWGWFIIVGLVVRQGWLVVQYNLYSHAMYPFFRPYVYAQVEPAPDTAPWYAMAEMMEPGFSMREPFFLVVSGVVSLLLGALMVVAALRYRTGLLLVLAPFFGIPLVSVIVDLASGGRVSALLYPPDPIDSASWLPGLAYIGLGLAVAGAVLRRWRRRHPQKPPMPSWLKTYLVPMVVTAAGLMMVAGQWRVLVLRDEDMPYVAMLWYDRWIQSDFQLAAHGLQLAGWLGVWLLVEAYGASRPAQRAVAGAWLFIALTVAVVVWRQPPEGYVSPESDWPRYSSGERVLGQALVWGDQSSWSLGATWFWPEVSAGVASLLASDEMADRSPVSYSSWMPELIALKADPFAPTLEFLSAVRRARPGYDSLILGSVTASQSRQMPLTDAGVADWMALAALLPTSIYEDLSLLGNLVGSGRRELASVQAARIRATLESIPTPLDVAPPDAEYEGEDSYYGRFEEVLAAYETLIAELPAPDGLPRSVKVSVLSATGRPLQGVPVGIFQTLSLRRRDSPVEDHPGPLADGLPRIAGGRFLLTDAHGEALFTGLGGVGYGTILLSGWPDSGLAADLVAVPIADLPERLPPGESVVEYRVLPQGVFRGDATGRLVLSPPANGTVMWPCGGSESFISVPCMEPLPLADALLPADADPAVSDPPSSLLEFGEDGRPRFVWLLQVMLDDLRGERSWESVYR
ncbi:hypothetical protein IIA16_05715 [bacterium]|nr:hypothetical protein [bacterium]